MQNRSKTAKPSFCAKRTKKTDRPSVQEKPIASAQPLEGIFTGQEKKINRWLMKSRNQI
jgi:hypothetical protein